MASFAFNRGAYLFVNGYDWVSASVGGALCTNAFTPTRSMNTLADITNELSGGGYSRISVTGKTTTENDGSNRVELGADDPIFPGLQAAAGTPQYLVLFDDTGLDATSQLLFVLDLGVPSVPDGSDYTIVLNAIGVASNSTT